MGLVLLDLQFRVEKAFKIRLPKDWHDQMGMSWKPQRSDATLAEFHAFLLGVCADLQVQPPADSWDVLVHAVMDASSLERQKLHPETYLVRDIAPGG